MKNLLSIKQRRLLQVIIGIIALVFIGYFFFNNKELSLTPKNTTVYIQNSNLQVFDDNYSLSQYPDKIALHYPYLLVIKPNLQTTYIYNLDQKKKEKEIKQVLLDYSNGNELSNEGKSTYLNNQDLGVLCEKGFIKSSEEILCVTKYDVNAVQNKLISINPKTKTQKDIYTSQGIITDVKVINNKTYLGEIDTYTHKNRILIDNNPLEVPNIVSMIYQMNGQPYFASFKSDLNKNTENYYSLESNLVTKRDENRILIFYDK